MDNAMQPATETTTTVVDAIENAPIVREIPAHNREELDKKLAKLAKRAAKLGAPISYEWGAEIVREYKRSCPCTRHSLAGCANCQFRGFTIEHRVYVALTVSTARPAFAGWEFLGTLDHTSIPGAVVRRMVPGVECPDAAIASKPGWCDHCRKVRARVETFVVRHVDGAVKVVGRSCTRDFLGHQAPSDISVWMDVQWRVGEAVDEDAAWESGGGRAPEIVEGSLLALATVFAVVRMDGAFRPKGMDHSTRSTVGVLLFGGWGEAARKVREGFEAKGGVTLADCERAWAALTWLCNERATSDFLHNVKAVAGAEWINHKNLGYFCAIAPAFDKALVKRTERTERKPSHHVGTVGERLDLGEAVVTKVIPFEGDYGLRYRILMRRDDGATLAWWCSSSSARGDVTEGDTVQVTATIKAHGSYKDEAQTELTRAKLVITKGVDKD